MNAPGLTREQIRANNLSKPVPVPAPEWGGVVYVLQLPVTVALALGTALKDVTGENSIATQLAAFLCDENGKLLYTKDEALEELVRQGMPAPVRRALDVAMKENGLGTEDSVKGNS